MNDTITLLRARRSAPPAAMSGPGPRPQGLLALAARVPDHGKLAYAKANPGGDDRRVEAERNRFCPAPLVVGVISRAAPQQKIPEWEQILSAGAVCMNLMVAANALGFASIWLTDWVAYDRAVLARLGVAENERAAGFIHIGRADDPREDRARAHLADIVTRF